MYTDRVQAAIFAGCLMYGIITVDKKFIISISKEGQPMGYGQAMSSWDAIRAADIFMQEEGLFSEPAGEREQMCIFTMTDIAGRLDEWMKQGSHAFMVLRDGDVISCRLSGMRTVIVDKSIVESVMDLGRAISWSCRGYIYETAPDPDRPMVGCITTTVLSSPRGDGDDGFGWRYPIGKIGTANGFWAAVNVAFEAEEFEVRLSRVFGE